MNKTVIGFIGGFSFALMIVATAWIYLAWKVAPTAAYQLEYGMYGMMMLFAGFAGLLWAAVSTAAAPRLRYDPLNTVVHYGE